MTLQILLAISTGVVIITSVLLAMVQFFTRDHTQAYRDLLNLAHGNTHPISEKLREYVAGRNARIIGKILSNPPINSADVIRRLFVLLGLIVVAVAACVFMKLAVLSYEMAFEVKISDNYPRFTSWGTWSLGVVVFSGYLRLIALFFQIKDILTKIRLREKIWNDSEKEIMTLIKYEDTVDDAQSPPPSPPDEKT